jgi:heat shock protein HslJ
MAARWVSGFLLISLLACDRGEKPAAATPPPAPAPAAPAAPSPVAAPSIADRGWELIALGAESDPLGMDGKPLRLRLDSATSRAGGFAGCNSYGGGYKLEGSSLTFGAMASTKMFCEPVQAQEDAYLKALAAVSTWQLADGVLTLRGDGVELRFREAAP